MRRTMKMLKFAARVFGLDGLAAARLGGARTGAVTSEEGLSEFLWTSRDSHERAQHLLTIITLLRDAYGDKLPPLNKISKDFPLNFEPILIEGAVADLLRLRLALEMKAGGKLA